MASVWYNKGLRKINDRTIDWVAGAGIKVMLLTTTTAYTLDKDHEFVSSVVASEAAGTGYTGGFGGAGRKAIGTRTITDDLTNDRTLFNSANPTAWTALTLTSGSIAWAIVFQEVTNDASSHLICALDPTDLVTNGGDVSLAFTSGQVGYIQQ